MKPCFNTITCGADKPLEVTLDLLGKYGYEGVEIEAGRIDDYLTRHSMSDLKRQLAKNRLQVAAIKRSPSSHSTLTSVRNSCAVLRITRVSLASWAVKPCSASTLTRHHQAWALPKPSSRQGKRRNGTQRSAGSTR